MYFNIEINILDQYSFECEKVHMLVFINYLTATILRLISRAPNTVHTGFLPKFSYPFESTQNVNTKYKA